MLDFLSYYMFLGLYLWAHEEFVLVFLFYFLIYSCGPTRRSCLLLFSVSGSILVLWHSCQIFPVGTRDCLVSPSSKLRVGKSVLLFYRTGHLLLYCQHTKLQVMKSLSPISRNFSRVVFLLKFGLASLPFLVNDGFDKPRKKILIIYVVGRTWGEVEVCLV